MELNSLATGGSRGTRADQGSAPQFRADSVRAVLAIVPTPVHTIVHKLRFSADFGDSRELDGELFTRVRLPLRLARVEVRLQPLDRALHARDHMVAHGRRGSIT